MTQAQVDVETLARIRDLEFISRIIIQGGAYGLHSSKQRGVGFEFSQYRSYQPGDDLRYVDWKLFARSDRIFVRESERESQQNVWFVCDLSSTKMQIACSGGPSCSPARKGSGGCHGCETIVREFRVS